MPAGPRRQLQVVAVDAGYMHRPDPQEWAITVSLVFTTVSTIGITIARYTSFLASGPCY